jgi:hypothetical protein
MYLAATLKNVSWLDAIAPTKTFHRVMEARHGARGAMSNFQGGNPKICFLSFDNRKIVFMMKMKLEGIFLESC